MKGKKMRMARVLVPAVLTNVLAEAQSGYNAAYPTNAMPYAPHAGRWFAEQFRILVENAEPPLIDDSQSASTSN